jgi:hypothetical protein
MHLLPHRRQHPVRAHAASDTVQKDAASKRFV